MTQLKMNIKIHLHYIYRCNSFSVFAEEEVNEDFVVIMMNMMMVLKCEKLNLRVLRNIVFKRDCNSQLLRKAKYSHRSENTSENAIKKLGKSHFTHDIYV